MMKLAWFGRLWQYAGISVAMYAAGRHSIVWGRSTSETTDNVMAASWTQFIVGVLVGIVVFWIGVFLEGRAKKLKDENATRIRS
jgi:hypothetical protein